MKPRNELRRVGDLNRDGTAILCYNEADELPYSLPADCEEVDRAIAAGLTAQEMLQQADPGAVKEFRRIDRALVKLLARVRENFPDATYYTASGTFLLMLGPSHGTPSGGEDPRQGRVAVDGKASIDGGDW